MRYITCLKSALLGAFLLGSAAAAQAESNDALLKILVRKGVLTENEASQVQEEMVKEEKKTAAGKLKLSDSVTQLKLSGDLRLRYQYDNKDFQTSAAAPLGGDGFDADGTQRSRWRFRLRLRADFELGDSTYGGVELQTALAADSANQTFEDGFSDYPIFISRAFLGYRFFSDAELEKDRKDREPYAIVEAGKTANPFYTTDLIWDPDVNPAGLVEVINFHKFFEPAPVASYSKDGKTAKTVEPGELPWTLSLRAGQFIFDDNLEGGGRDPGVEDNDETTDAYIFQTQLVGAYTFPRGSRLTFAPGWFVANAASVTAGVDLNENDFQDDDGIDVSGATRNLNILLLPGDYTTYIGPVRTSFYWDVAYNFNGRKRVEEIYDVIEQINAGDDPDDRQAHSPQDNFAFLVGLQLGDDKKRNDKENPGLDDGDASDFSFNVNYRQTGLGAVDPNLNDSDFALSELNTRGFKFSLGYNITKYAIFNVTYMHAWNLRGDLVGGEATSGNAVADGNAIQVLQVDLNVKF